MSALNILQSLLGAGKQLMEQAGNTAQNATSGDNPLISKQDKTTLGAGALAVLLGQKTDSNLATYGGLAALGTVAYKAFQRWQESQAAQATTQSSNANTGFNIPMPTPVNQMPAQQAETQSQALLVAMISAAKADGHIQADEKAQLDAQFAKISDPQERAWLQQELEKPVNPADVARLANNNPHLGAQMYALSLAMVDDTNFMERAYLDELAKQLNLEPGLKAELEAQVKQQF